MLKQAEKMQEEDRKNKKEMIEMKNEAKSLIYNSAKI